MAVLALRQRLEPNGRDPPLTGLEAEPDKRGAPWQTPRRLAEWLYAWPKRTGLLRRGNGRKQETPRLPQDINDIAEGREG